jgi:hypothetical protein
MKELSAPDAAAARKMLEQPTDELKHHGRRLIRMLSRHLRPAVDYFEMQTGQRIGALFCAHLPERLSWLEEALATRSTWSISRPTTANGSLRRPRRARPRAPRALVDPAALPRRPAGARSRPRPPPS